MPPPVDAGQIERTFAKFDADGSGTIDADEFVEFWTKTGKNISVAEVLYY